MNKHHIFSRFNKCRSFCVIISLYNPKMNIINSQNETEYFVITIKFTLSIHLGTENQNVWPRNCIKNEFSLQKVIMPQILLLLFDFHSLNEIVNLISKAILFFVEYIIFKSFNRDTKRERRKVYSDTVLAVAVYMRRLQLLMRSSTIRKFHYFDLRHASSRSRVKAKCVYYYTHV